MHPCLRITEVLARIVNGSRPRDALQLALTCKSFLEPGLDEVWHEIHSFDPLIACLPVDLWKDPVGMPLGTGMHHVMELRRGLTSEDLRRYITYYAPRIRVLSPDWSGRRIPSIETFRALELATDFQQGALSPRLKEFSWYRAYEVENHVGKALSNSVAPCMFLFIAGTVTNLAIPLAYPATIPLLHQASIELSVKRHAQNLKKLSIGGAEYITQRFDGFLWSQLRDLTLTEPSTTIFPVLASLPRLEALDITCIAEENIGPQAAHGFASLRRLRLLVSPSENATRSSRRDSARFCA